MNLELFIAKRIYKGNEGEKKVSPPAVRIAIISIALGLTVMILSVSIVIGFKQEVRNKIIGFGSHIQITNFDNNTSYETQPIAISDSLLRVIQEMPNIKHVEKFATKPGIIKTEEDFQGIIVKGVGEDFNWSFFKQNLIEGTTPEITSEKTTNDVVISQTLSNKLHLKLGDSFNTFFFVNQNMRPRKFNIVGIYQTNFSEYDKLFISDIKHVRKLNDWEEDMVSGLEILVDDYNQLDQTTYDLAYLLSAERDRLGNAFYVRSIKQINPMIFSWLDLLDVNVMIILILMLVVPGFTTISGLLIIILEKTNMIGILKAMGQNNKSIRKIFLYVSFFLIGKGLFWGNIIGLTFCFLQKYFGIIKLDPQNYYISVVPVEINFWHIILLNILTLVISMLILIGPSYIISKISPAKTIRFE
ncbi:MAG: ABC transporter permease [Dysgonamonadaceae bacterium]|jgi:lipoprotein-releasing system permease protein|nr:ABC transporter permease [Dysgonamonadaceae bacterium]